MLGSELRKARVAAGMTQEALAFAAGVDRSYISQLENDKRSPTLDYLIRVCEAMGTSAGTIVARIEKARRRGRNAR
jgi:transcriptional regulator with XRE-family HTH domain